MKKTSKIIFGLLAASLLSAAGTSSASAQTITAQFTVLNSFGATIFLDTGSCTVGSIFPPTSISNNGSQTFGATVASPGSTLCTVRYRNAAGTLGCQFSIDATTAGQGFATQSPYLGNGTGPHCSVTATPTTGNQSGSFTMQP